MIIDGQTLRSDSEISASVCIVGSGPAGVALATELRQARIDVVLLESGGTAIDAWAQALNEGPAFAEAYTGLRETRHRQLGGTLNAWNTPVQGEIGAKYLPLEPVDLDATELAGPWAAWPIDYPELAAFYPAAHRICGLGPVDYGPTAMLQAGRQPFELGGGHLVSKIYRFGRASSFLETHLPALCAADDARVATNTTACELVGATGTRVAAIKAVTRGGRRTTVRAKIFVLAAGAIENARLLLLARAAAPGFLEDTHDWLGRCFMEHPRDTALTLLPGSPAIFERARFYDACDTVDGQTVCGRLAFAAGPPPHSGLPNMSVTLQARARPAGSLLSRWKRGRRKGPRRGYGWSAEPDLVEWFDGFRLLINLEQRPRPGNRIVLADDRDALGQPRVALHWEWSAEEQAALVRLRALLARELESAGIGRVEIDRQRRPDPNAHHHAGTTRMAESARDGVVDRDCRVFGADNLYVTGASVFPTAGFANPTLTIVALAARLAAHLRQRLG